MHMDAENRFYQFNENDVSSTPHDWLKTTNCVREKPENTRILPPPSPIKEVLAKNLKISVQNGVKKCQNGGNGVLNMWMASIKYIHSTTYSSFLLLIFHPFL